MSGLEPLAILGAISACSQLAGSFAELAKIISSAIKGVRYIPGYIRDLRNDVEIFEICLRKLKDAAREAYKNSNLSEQAHETARAISIIVSQGNDVKRKILELVADVRRNGFSMTLSQWLSRLGLAFKEPAVQCLQSFLNSMKGSAQFLGTTVLLETFTAKIRDLERRNEVIPAHLEQTIRRLKQEVKEHKGIDANLRRDLRERVEEFGLQKELAKEVAQLRTLNRCLSKKVAVVAPELSTRRRRTRSRRSSSLSSRNDSGLGSSKASPEISTPRTPAIHARRNPDREHLHVQEVSRPASTVSDIRVITPPIRTSISEEEFYPIPVNEEVFGGQQSSESPVDTDVEAPLVIAGAMSVHEEAFDDHDNGEQVSIPEVEESFNGLAVREEEDRIVEELHRPRHLKTSATSNKPSITINHIRSDPGSEDRDTISGHSERTVEPMRITLVHPDSSSESEDGNSMSKHVDAAEGTIVIQQAESSSFSESEDGEEMVHEHFDGAEEYEQRHSSLSTGVDEAQRRTLAPRSVRIETEAISSDERSVQGVSKDMQQHRLRRSKGAIKAISSTSPPRGVTTESMRKARKDERYTPMAPFNDGDRNLGN